MTKYYAEKLREQADLMATVTSAQGGSSPPCGGPHGQLNVRAYYNRDANILAVEVLSARSLIPLDTNGKSKSFFGITKVPATLSDEPGIRTWMVRPLKRLP